MPLRYVSRETIESELSKAITYITFNPDPELPALLESALAIEICDISKDILHCMLENIKLAPKIEIPLCQDTGSFIVFAEIGNQCIIQDAPYHKLSMTP